MLTADVSAAVPGASNMVERHRIAVLLPCHNEEPAIAEVIERIRRHLAGDAQDFRNVAIDVQDAPPFARVSGLPPR